MALTTRGDFLTALTRRELPTIVSWNRLEGRPRSADFDDALRAEVRDALWMLSKQWQMGEFIGEDAGSPVESQILLEQTPFSLFRAGDGPAEPFSDDLPLEAQVERQPLTLLFESGPVALDLRIAFGRRWHKLLRRDVLDGHLPGFLERYPIARPDSAVATDAPITAHPEVWQRYAAAAGRVVDGGALYLHLAAASGNRPDDGIAGVPPADRDAIELLAQEFLAWVARLFEQPGEGEDAWDPGRLEYRCSVAPEPPGTELTAKEYYQGRIDWYSFDRAEAGASAPPAPTEKATSFIPSPVTFDGMPHTRWWQFEEGKTDFGTIDPSTTDLAKLLFVEFMLLYANDWFLFPYRVTPGVEALVRGLSVTNVFGERFWIDPAGSRAEDGWQKWGLFANSAVLAPNDTSDRRIAVLPTVAKIQDAQENETVVFIRDEMANQVWGIEQQVRLPSGRPKRGAESGQETRTFFASRITLAGDGEVETGAVLRYRIMSTVPEHWIPFISVHEENDNRQTRLQRAAMPRLVEGDPDPPVRIRPRTALLRRGLDQDPRAPYFIDEEEVPRAGIYVQDGFRRARWYGGETVLWRGLRKHVGRGEGSSGLAFDQLLPKPAGPPRPEPPVPPPGHAAIEHEGPNPPQVALKVSRDAVAGWNLHATLTDFELAPERASTGHRDGEGHLHLYLDGVKLTRVYGEWFHLPDLLEGEHRVRLEVSANDHSPIAVDGEFVGDTATLVQPPAGAHGHAAVPAEVVPKAGAPGVALAASEDPAGGWNLRFELSRFTLAPAHTSGAHVPGEGHLHLSIDGHKWARVYAPWHYLPPLAAGTHQVKVEAVTNDHRRYATDAGPVEATVELKVAGSDRSFAGPGHPH